MVLAKDEVSKTNVKPSFSIVLREIVYF